MPASPVWRGRGGLGKCGVSAVHFNRGSGMAQLGSRGRRASSTYSGAGRSTIASFGADGRRFCRRGFPGHEQAGSLGAGILRSMSGWARHPHGPISAPGNVGVHVGFEIAPGWLTGERSRKMDDGKPVTHRAKGCRLSKHKATRLLQPPVFRPRKPWKPPSQNVLTNSAPNREARED